MHVRIVFVSLWLAACGQVLPEGAPESADDRAADGSADARDRAADASDAGDASTEDSGDDTADAGPFTCGATTCAGDAYCIVPCSGGVLPVCIPEEAGACPTGTRRGQCLGDAGPTTAGCVTNPPPPYCSPTPSCNGGSGMRQGREVHCICA